MKTYNLIFLLVVSWLLLACDKDNNPDPDPVTPDLILTDLVVQERNTDFRTCVNIRLSETTDQIVSVKVKTEDGSAIDGEDYIGISELVKVIDPGQIAFDVCIDIIGDEDFEQDEDFLVIITEADGAIITNSSCTVTIENDDQNNTVVIPTSGYSTPMSYPGMELIWQDEFDILDLDHWTFEIGNGNNGWGNQESQFYRRENTRVLDGNLVITAREENFSGFNYTSSRLRTLDKFSFKYGRVDIRAALPYGQGIWPALWMLGSNFPTVGWPACGEIDIMEMIGGSAPGRDNTVHGTAHWEQNSTRVFETGKTSLNSGIFHGRFHVFSIEWDENSITWYLDDQPYFTLDTSPAQMSEFREDFFFIVNMAVGGLWPGYPDGTTRFPQHLIVDYIRVFQEN